MPASIAKDNGMSYFGRRMSEYQVEARHLKASPFKAGAGAGGVTQRALRLSLHVAGVRA